MTETRVEAIEARRDALAVDASPLLAPPSAGRLDSDCPSAQPEPLAVRVAACPCLRRRASPFACPCYGALRWTT
jgi:hypothetical protein